VAGFKLFFLFIACHLVLTSIFYLWGSLVDHLLQGVHPPGGKIILGTATLILVSASLIILGLSLPQALILQGGLVVLGWTQLARAKRLTLSKPKPSLLLTYFFSPIYFICSFACKLT